MMNQCKSQQTPNINKIRYYTEQNTEQFINLIEKQDFTKVHNLYDTDLAYNEFLSIINSAHDKAFPIQIAKEKTHVIRKEPWITSGLMTSSHNKTKLHRKKKNTQ